MSKLLTEATKMAATANDQMAEQVKLAHQPEGWMRRALLEHASVNAQIASVEALERIADSLDTVVRRLGEM